MIIGIDPGITGAIAFYDNGEMRSLDMPTVSMGKKNEIDEDALAKLLCEPIDFAVIEKQHAFPGQGCTAGASLMEGVGIIRGILVAYRVAREFVSTKTWHNEFGISLPPINKGLKEAKEAARARVERKKEIKEQVYRIAVRLYPSIEYRTKRGVLLDGRADSVLLAEYARRIYNSRNGGAGMKP